jgi:hypothetical protein
VSNLKFESLNRYRSSILKAPELEAVQHRIHTSCYRKRRTFTVDPQQRGTHPSTSITHPSIAPNRLSQFYDRMTAILLLGAPVAVASSTNSCSAPSVLQVPTRDLKFDGLRQCGGGASDLSIVGPRDEPWIILAETSLELDTDRRS